MANLWPKTVIALTLAGIDPVPVSVLGLSTEGYYTFELERVDAEPSRVVTNDEGDPIRVWHDWPSESIGKDVFEAYLSDLEGNYAQWLTRDQDTP